MAAKGWVNQGILPPWRPGMLVVHRKEKTKQNKTKNAVQTPTHKTNT